RTRREVVAVIDVEAREKLARCPERGDLRAVLAAERRGPLRESRQPAAGRVDGRRAARALERRGRVREPDVLAVRIDERAAQRQRRADVHVAVEFETSYANFVGVRKITARGREGVAEDDRLVVL